MFLWVHVTCGFPHPSPAPSLSCRSFTMRPGGMSAPGPTYQLMMLLRHKPRGGDLGMRHAAGMGGYDANGELQWEEQPSAMRSHNVSSGSGSYPDDDDSIENEHGKAQFAKLATWRDRVGRRRLRAHGERHSLRLLPRMWDERDRDARVTLRISPLLLLFLLLRHVPALLVHITRTPNGQLEQSWGPLIKRDTLVCVLSSR
ncbi:hypothetical protein JB92DRAFT_2836820 [Gautieria morchelliformis]|nr:hypothetical protein JB92DRAFT_2836820 [Gautieria morchelliformis]